MRLFIVGIMIASASLLGACEKEPGTTSTADRCPHEIKAEKCPFCTPILVESEGFCGEHAVAEAMCVACRPYLKAAFRAKGDWCATHGTADTQCVDCHPELKEKMKPGSGHGHAHAAAPVADPNAPACEHTIAASTCPFCTPALIERDGLCSEHGVAEALCVTCRPYLEAAFKAKGDWCEAHHAPDSQCVTCHPELKKPEGNG